MSQKDWNDQQLKTKALAYHAKHHGKIGTKIKVKVNNAKQLALAYSPGVIAPCLEIVNDQSELYQYTMKQNTVAIITDGTAVLGLGAIGCAASLPVMEGKAVIFKKFAKIDAVPICINTTDTALFVQTVKLMTTSFGAINLEDIAAPRCFEIENQLQKELDIPVFHDDQHGTAIVVAAALINACRLKQVNLKSLKICLVGLGAAGTAIAHLLHALGVKQIIAYDKQGVVSSKKQKHYAAYIKQLLKQNVIVDGVNYDDSLAGILHGCQVFIGVSVGNLLTPDLVGLMAEKPWVFALANPTPEIDPTLAIKAGAEIVATGRSDYPNQINNALVFPGLFQAVLRNHIQKITLAHQIKCAEAIAATIPLKKLQPNYIIPTIFNRLVVQKIQQVFEDFTKKTA